MTVIQFKENEFGKLIKQKRKEQRKNKLGILPGATSMCKQTKSADANGA